MVTTEIKNKKINHFALVLLILIFLGQGYTLYQKVAVGITFKESLCSQLIENVIPSTVLAHKDTNLFGDILYILTDLDLDHYKTLIEKNIPLARYTALLANHEDSLELTGLSRFRLRNNKGEDLDYFDQSQEISAISFNKNSGADTVVTRDQLADDQYVLQKLINFDANLNHDNQAMALLDIPELTQRKFRLTQQDKGPQVLIMHTHSMERFAGEEPGSQGVVDLGRYLTKILESQYGLSVLHCTDSFDVVDGRTERSGSYERMEPVIEKIIAENPTIQLVMDIHRDGIGSNQKFLANVNGHSAAKLMFVNGFCQVQKQGVLTPIGRLPNPYVKDNMALSLQLQLRANELYPGLMRKSLVKPYRYSLHMKPMSLLIEVGNQNNIKEEALHTMDALAEILMDVIEKD